MIAPHDHIASPEPEAGLIDLLTAIGEEKTLIAGLTGLATAIGLAISLMLPAVYTARTTLLPPQQGQGAASALASLGALAATTGLGAAIKTSEELYVGLLKTDSVANAVIARFKLQDRYGEQTLVNTRRELGKNVRVSADRKSTLISIDADDQDPAFAAQLANAYSEELRTLMSRIAVTEAQQRRAFFEGQMAKAKDELVKAELAVKQAQDTGGLFSVDAQTQTMIGAAAQIRAQIVAREVQLQAMRAYAGPENAQLRGLLAELASLRSQLARMEGGATDAAPKTADSRDALGNVRLYRELKYQEAIYTTMLQQYQLAKSDEARDAPLVQQVDVATPPDRRSKPARATIVVGAAFLGLFLGLVLALVRRAARQAARDPVAANQWSALRAAWSLGRR
ncbi:MAG: chain-length determining protein [Ramlibacter sp.]|nr:chain-length determining protein [Ramlibacter sp.]